VFISFSNLWFGSFHIIFKKQFLLRVAFNIGRVAAWQCRGEKIRTGIHEGAEAGKPQNHRMVRVGKDLKDHLVPTPPAMSRDIFHQPGVLRAPSSLALNPAREGASTASLGNLGQCFSTLMVKNFFLIPNLNLPSFSLQSFLLVLSLHTLVKSPSPSFL